MFQGYMTLYMFIKQLLTLVSTNIEANITLVSLNIQEMWSSFESTKRNFVIDDLCRIKCRLVQKTV